VRIRRIIETCIYSSDLETMKNFYINKVGLEFSSEEQGRHIFLKAGRSMLLIFNPENTKVEENSRC
jgi:catechol-2,3-dioxygenase